MGRESELTQLHQWFEQALHGHRQLVFVTGEPGIGKTTLVEAFLERLETRDGRLALTPQASSFKPLVSSVWIGRGQCVEQHGQGEAYLPILEVLSRLGQEPGGKRVVEVLRRYAPTWLAQLPALLEAGERRELQATVQGATQQRMLRELAEALEVLTVEQPLILILEDLHWSDASTLEVLAYMGQRRDRARLLVVGTYRPTEVILQGHRLKGVKQELETHGQCAELRVELLTADDVREYLAVRFPDEELPAKLAAEVHRRTEGNALFMVNLVEEWVRQGVIARGDGHWQVQESLAVKHTPETVRQVIERQLERLGKQEQQLLEIASVVGMEFSVAAVTAGLKREGDEIEDMCEELAWQGHFLEERGIAEWPDGTVSGRYGFRHALYQNVLYARIAEMRRMRLHRLIGERLEAGYGEQARELAAELAMHFEQGRDYQRAVQYLERAAGNALQRSAYVEATGHLSKGLELLKTLPETMERLHQELHLQIPLGLAFTATKSYAAPEVGHAYTRARELCQQLGATAELAQVLSGLWAFHGTRAELPPAYEAAEQLLRLGQHTQDPALVMEGHYVVGQTSYFMGQFASAREHFEQGLTFYNPKSTGSRRIEDLSVACLSSTALSLGFLGYHDQALRTIHEARARAHELSHPFSVAFALICAAVLHALRRELQAVQEEAAALIAFSMEQEFPFRVAQGTILRGWALAMQGQAEEGIAQLRQGMAAYSATGAEAEQSNWLGLLAAAYGQAGRAKEGLSALDEALERVSRGELRWYEAELYRLKGELILQSSVPRLGSSVQRNQKAKIKGQKSKMKTDPRSLMPDAQVEAEACFLKAIEISQRQQAKSLELRAVMSLVRLRQHQASEHGSRNTRRVSRTTQHETRTRLDEARTMLSEIYNWFTEGFDTKDLQEAKALLDELGR